jgi:GTP-binding protein Era
MVTISFDPEAQTVYWYFTEIETDSTTDEGECDGTLLLDAQGDIIGLELELDQAATRGALDLALDHPQVRFDQESFTLTISFFDEEPESFQPLHDSVILDVDADGRFQGCEIVAAKSFGLGERLGRLAPFTVALEDDSFVPPHDRGGFANDDEDEQPEEPQNRKTAEPTTEGERPGASDDSSFVIRHSSTTQPSSIVHRPSSQDHQPPATNDEPSADEISQASIANPDGFRSGFVALVGPPNAGKSTLLNALLGQKVAIVSPLPQTTRTAIRGILTRPDAQVIFVDTPGIHQPRTRLGNYMVDQARRAIPDSDVVCLVVDIARPPGQIDERIAAMVRRARSPKILVLNKIDQRRHQGAEHVELYRNLAPWDMEVAISALRRLGLEQLMDEIVTRLPVERALYPTDQVTDQSERELVSELVREQVLRHTQQEVPHGVAVEIEEWEQRTGALYMRLSVYVEKDSQKGILIGAGGQMLKQIGSAARKNIEAALEQPVFLDLWVKTRSNWRDDPNALHWLGYKNQK